MHAVVLIALIHSSAPWIAPIRLPGSPHGSNLILTYSPGRAPLQRSPWSPKKALKQTASTTPLPESSNRNVSTSPATSNATSPAYKQPDATTGEDALGSGDVNIALASYFPTPQPDLSGLPGGTKGDVVLDIVIDSFGKIANVTMASGIGHGVDENVIATVQQWTFHPATRDGQPVASEQELHFHYEKG